METKEITLEQLKEKCEGGYEMVKDCLEFPPKTFKLIKITEDDKYFEVFFQGSVKEVGDCNLREYFHDLWDVKLEKYNGRREGHFSNDEPEDEIYLSIKFDKVVKILEPYQLPSYKAKLYKPYYPPEKNGKRPRGFF